MLRETFEQRIFASICLRLMKKLRSSVVMLKGEEGGKGVISLREMWYYYD